MSVSQLDKSRCTKDGKRWVFRTRVKLVNGQTKQYMSKKYSTRQEALKAEREFLNKVDENQYDPEEMTFQQLYEEFRKYKEDKVKTSTKRGYTRMYPRFKMFYNKKMTEITVSDYLKWRAWINSMPIALKTKNGYHKFFKEILNYGTRWHDYNFTKLYNRMEKFVDPNSLPKEMLFYTYEEFQQFISVETDVMWKAVFETFYYCGLRRGELRGLKWDIIDFDEKTLTVKRNIVNEKGGNTLGFWEETTPKTKSSNRTIPMPDVLVDDLKSHKENMRKYANFSEDWFVFGDMRPLHPHTLLQRKNKNAKLAGVKQIRTHDFRHSCASLLINNGANIMIVAKYLGHTKIDETLNTYTHLFKDKMDDVVNLVNELNRKN